MTNTETLYLRLKTCVDTVLEVKASLEGIEAVHELVDSFDELQKALKTVDPDLITESEVLKVESATNQLMEQLKYLIRADE
jgi:copper chaperone CopZ